jgi:hypothetical protein
MIVKSIKKLFREEQFKIVSWDMKKPLPFKIDLQDIINKIDSGEIKFASLTVDGGGILGILPATILYILFKQDPALFCKFISKLHWIGGSSIGAVIAGYIAMGHTPQEILEILIINGPSMFQDRSIFGKLLGDSLYKSDEKDKLMLAKFGRITFKELAAKSEFKQTLNVTVVSKITKKTRICNWKTTPDWDVAQTIGSSTDAPFYFEPREYNGDILCDGGTGTYNCLLEEATNIPLYEMKLKPSEFFTLSLGCGTSENELGNTVTKKEKEEVKKQGKLKSVMFAFMMGREEAMTKQENEFKELKEELGLQGFRWNICLPKHLDAMSETNNINEIVSFINNPASHAGREIII